MDKLADSRKYRHTAKITCNPRSEFPIDMLRYDCAFPATSADSTKIANLMDGRGRIWSAELSGEDGPVVIRVARYSDTKEHGFNICRWKTFGCEVEVEE